MINKNESQKEIIMNLATRVYELFKEDEIKAKGMAEIFQIIEDRFLPRIDSATKADIKQNQLEVTLKIEKVRVEIEKVRNELKVDIERGRNELKVDIERGRNELKIDIEKVRNDTEKVKTDLMKHMNRQVIWIIASISLITGSLVGLLKLLDYFVK